MAALRIYSFPKHNPTNGLEKPLPLILQRAWPLRIQSLDQTPSLHDAIGGPRIHGLVLGASAYLINPV